MTEDSGDVTVGAPIWVDLTSSDVANAREFYPHVFGWEALEANEEFGGYFMFMKDGQPIAGCMPAMEDNPARDVWLTYLSSSDARATVQSAHDAGATVVAPAMDVADLGTMAVVLDPSAAAIGVWEPKAHRGFGVHGGVGTPGWYDLQASDYDRTLDFYRDVFSLENEALPGVPQSRYSALKAGDEMVAGVGDAAAGPREGEPSAWTIVFNVDDTDKTVEQVLGLGGSVVAPAMDSPYGRLATLRDPQGAVFGVVDSNRSE